MKKLKGFTLIEVMICIAIVGILAATFAGQLGDHSKDAEVQMVDHVSFLYPDATDVRAKCASRDSDGDGYVRCTGTFTYIDAATNAATRGKEVSECAWIGSGCADIKPKIRVNSF